MGFINKGILTGSAGLLVAAILAPTSAFAASTFSNNLWQFASGNGASVIDFNRDASGIWSNGELHVASANFITLDAGQRVSVSNALALNNGPLLVANTAQVGNLNAVNNVHSDGTISAGGAVSATGGFFGNLTGDVTGNTSGTHTGNVRTNAINATDSGTVLHIGESTDVTILGGSGKTTNVAGTLTTDRNVTVAGTLSATGTPAGDGSGTVNADSSISATGTGIYGAANRGRLTLGADFGSSTDALPSAGLGMYGKVAGANLAGTSNFIAGTVGTYGVTGTNASKFYKVGLLGSVSSETTTADAAVMALLDGDSGLTTARAGYGIMTLNSTDGSGFDYGMDLKIQVVTGLESETRPFKVADIRLSSGTTIGSGATNPATCVKGSIYLNTTSGLLNVCQTANNWTEK